MLSLGTKYVFSKYPFEFDSTVSINEPPKEKLNVALRGLPISSFNVPLKLKVSPTMTSESENRTIFVDASTRIFC